MGCAMVQGLLRAGHAASDLVIVETSAERRAELTKLFAGIHIAADTPRCDEAIIAVKPADVATACARVVAAGARRVISIAAGVRIAAIQAACGADVRVIRAMPNTRAVVGLRLLLWLSLTLVTMRTEPGPARCCKASASS